MGTFIGVFTYCSPAKKNSKQHIGLNFDFFFNLFFWRYSTMKNLQYFVLFTPQELYLEVCSSKEIIFPLGDEL